MVGTAITSRVGDGIGVLVVVGSRVNVGGIGEGVSEGGTGEGMLVGKAGTEKRRQLSKTISSVSEKKIERIDFFMTYLLIALTVFILVRPNGLRYRRMGGGVEKIGDRKKLEGREKSKNSILPTPPLHPRMKASLHISRRNVARS